jgi:hypothetical protein
MLLQKSKLRSYSSATHRELMKAPPSNKLYTNV